jgi:AbrB family looped-hinge helix DNA binding protein
MTTRLTIDGTGRVVIPKLLRDKLDIGPGDELELENTGDNITLRRLRAATPLAKEKGVWVFRTGHPLPASTTEDVLVQIREERDRQNLGGVK